MVLEDKNVIREHKNAAEQIINQLHNLPWLKHSTTDYTREATDNFGASWNGTTRNATNKNNKTPKERKSLPMDDRNKTYANPSLAATKKNAWSTEVNAAASLFANTNSKVNIVLSEEEQMMLALEESMRIAETRKEITDALNENSDERVDETKEKFKDECSWDNVRKNLPPENDEENRQILEVNNNLYVEEEASSSRIHDEDKIKSKGRCITARISRNNNEDKIQETENSAKSVVESPEPAIKPNFIDKYGRIDGLNERRMFMGVGARKKEQIYMNQQLAKNSPRANEAQYFPEENANKVDSSNRKINKNANYSQGKPSMKNSYEEGSLPCTKEGGKSENYSSFSHQFHAIAKDRVNRRESSQEKLSQDGNVPKVEKQSRVTTKSEFRTPMNNRVVKNSMLKEVEYGVKNVRKNIKDSGDFCNDKRDSKLPSLMDFKSRFNHSPEIKEDRSMPLFPSEVTSDTMKFDANSMKMYYGDPNVNDFHTTETPKSFTDFYRALRKLPNMEYPSSPRCLLCHKVEESFNAQRNEPSLYRLLMEKKARECCAHDPHCLNAIKFHAPSCWPEINASNENFLPSPTHTILVVDNSGNIVNATHLQYSKDLDPSHSVTANIPRNVQQNVPQARYDEAASNLRRFIDKFPVFTDMRNQEGSFDQSIDKNGQYSTISQRSGQYGTSNNDNIPRFYPNQENSIPSQTMNRASTNPRRYNANCEVSSRYIVEKNFEPCVAENPQMPSGPRGRGRLHQK